MQSPPPKHIDEAAVVRTLDPGKDVDGFHSKTQFMVPIAAAVEEILKHIFIRSHLVQGETFMQWLEKQTFVVIGKGKTGGQPIIDLLQSKEIHPIIVASKTENPEAKIKIR